MFKRVVGPLLFSTCCVLVLFVGSAMATPSFVNGNFEAGVSTGWDLMNSINTPGWGINYGNGSVFPRLNLNQSCGGPYGNNNQGCQFATIGGVEDGGTSSLQQTVGGFIPGQTYTLHWLQSSEFTSSDVLNVSFLSGSNTAAMDFASVPYPGGSQYWYTWESMSYSFVANSSSVTFLFHSYGTNYEVGVDDFYITGGSVPEPGTLALVGSAIAGLGVFRRRFLP